MQQDDKDNGKRQPWIVNYKKKKHIEYQLGAEKTSQRIGQVSSLR